MCRCDVRILCRYFDALPIYRVCQLLDYTASFAEVFEHSPTGMFGTEATVFLLGTHPYDVGDQVQLDSGDTLTVDRMSIMTTQFIKGDNSRRTSRTPSCHSRASRT